MLQLITIAVIKVCSETSFSKVMVKVICNQFTDFYMIRVFTERYFSTDYSTGFLPRYSYF